MNQIVEAFTWLEGSGNQHFKSLVKPIMSDNTQVGIVNINFSTSKIGSIGYMVFDNPLNKKEKIKIVITINKHFKLKNYFDQLSIASVKDHVLFTELNKIRYSRNIKNLNNKDEMDKTSKSFIDLFNNFDKRGCTVPSIEIIDGIAKLVIPNNDYCEFKFLDISIKHASVTNKTYIDLYKLNDLILPEIMYGINIKFNTYSSKSTNLLYKRIADLNVSNITHVSINEKFLNSFKIIITDPTCQEVDTQGSIVLHFISK